MSRSLGGTPKKDTGQNPGFTLSLPDGCDDLWTNWKMRWAPQPSRHLRVARAPLSLMSGLIPGIAAPIPRRERLLRKPNEMREGGPRYRGCYHKPPDVIMKAAEGCPSVAIVVIDEDTGEQVYP